MSSREEFEAEMLIQFEIDLKPFRKVYDTGFDGYCLDGCFTSERSQLATCAWMMWQRSRETMVIKLPSSNGGRKIFPEDYRKAIESAGAKCQ